MNSLGDADPPADRTPGTWHADPLGGKKERKWDGNAWTAEIRALTANADAPSRSVEQDSAKSSPPTKPKPPGPDGAAREDPFRRWVRSRPVWAVCIAVGVALIAGMGLGAAGQSSEINDKDSQIESLESQIAGLESDKSGLEQDVADANSQADQVMDQAKDVKAQAKAQAAAVKAQAAKVAAREEKVSAAEQTIKHNTFGDGVWQVGVDFDAGTYRSSAADCYWEKLSSAGGDFNDIISNGSGPNQTVTIDSPWFSSSYCGKWTKIG